MNIVVSDTSPIRALHAIERLDVLPQLFPTIHIPLAVFRELTTATPTWAAIPQEQLHFLTVTQPVLIPDALLRHPKLHSGEIEALALALELRSDFLLVDEAEAREVAGNMGLLVLGVVGILIQAHDRGLVQRIVPLLDRLRTEFDFRLSDILIKHAAEKTGEI